MCPNVSRLNSDLISNDEEKKIAALREIMDLAQNNAGDPSFVPPLLVIMDEGSAACKQMASWSLGKLAQTGTGDDSELEPLVESLLDDDEEVRENSAWALGELAGQHVGTKNELEPLTALLDDKTATIRGMAAWALGRLAQRMGLVDVKTIVPLEKLVSDRAFTSARVRSTLCND